MKKGCALSFGCTGIIVILLFAVVVINFLSNVNFSFDGFSETSSDYTFDVDTLGNQPIIVADYKWKFTSTSLGRKNYKISFKILEFEVKKALAYLDEVAELSASDLNIDSKYRFDKVNYAKRTWHEIYKRIYWQSYGLNSGLLTDYIYNLYESDKRSRVFSADQMVEYTKKGALFVIQCIDTDSLTSVDYYTFAKDQVMWSLQFVPKNKTNPNIPDSKNGYILTTVITGVPYNEHELTYQCEVWIFDANELNKGPVCKLNHPQMSFGFTIHSAWVPETKVVSKPDYVLNVKEDYDFMIQKVKDAAIKTRIQQLFDTEVYPHFPS